MAEKNSCEVESGNNSACCNKLELANSSVASKQNILEKIINADKTAETLNKITSKIIENSCKKGSGCCRNKSDKSCQEEQVRTRAYLLWESSTGGVPVDDEQTNQFWLDAEKEICSQS